MKTYRVLLAAIPIGVLALGAVVLGKWSFRNIFSPRPSARAAESPVAGSAEEVAGVAEAMAEEGGPVLMTEVTPIGDGDALVTETLLVADRKSSEDSKPS